MLRSRALSAAVAVAACGGAPPLAAQSTLPADTYRDAATRALVERAVEARRVSSMGIESYEATLRQRMHVGLTAFRFRRERGLFDHERIARIRWSQDGQQAIQWIGARTAVPIVGADTGDPEARARVRVGDGAVTVGVPGDRGDEEEVLEGEDDASDYLDETDFPGFDFDPAADRLRFGDEWAFHPLSDAALIHYRYSPGDTLRVELPSIQQTVVLYELLVEPRRPDFELLAGSLWIDSTSAALVRATYRPARPWSMRLDEPDAADEVPGFVGPIEAEISYITVESTLQEFRYWLPRRFAFQAEGRAGSLFRMPVTLEWTVGGYLVNEPPAQILVEGELPEGWQREVTVETDDDGIETTYTVVVPTTEELLFSPALSDDFGRRTPVSFSASELQELASELEGLVPTYRPFRPQLAWGLEDGQLRFNRVEGLSAGLSTSIALDSRLWLELSGRIGTGDRVPNAEVGLRSGPETDEWRIEAYHRLASMNLHDDPFTLLTSLKNLSWGGDRGEYYRTTGATVARRTRGTSVRTELSAFYERHRAVQRTTDFSIRGFLRDDTVYTTLSADEIDLTGARAALGWFVGTDPTSWIATGELEAEVGFGDATYQRVDGRLSVGHPLVFGLAGALEVAAGTSWDQLPTQRSFFLGSSRTLRGFSVNELRGPSYWRGRGELATAFAGARVSLFTDWGWVGWREAFRFDDPYGSVGAGASLLDGLVRLDLARAVRGSDRWKLYLYLDGLL